MRRTQAWMNTNIWGEVERWYRLPGRIDAELIEDLGGSVRRLQGPWASVLRSETVVHGSRVWLSAHEGGTLLCASSDGSPVIFAEVDAAIVWRFGPLEELDAMPEYPAELAWGA